MKLRTVLIDDEPRAHVILENYASRTNQIELVGKFLNAASALEFMQNHEVDLILLDITMPVMDGFSFLSKLSKPPMVIFTTAYAEFALESYEFNALDYLRKPIPYERFAKAIEKAKARILGTDRTRHLPTSITLKIDNKDVQLPFDTISYFQSFGNYVKIFTAGKVLITQITTKEIEEHLPIQTFVRIHKSFIVNRLKIQSINDSFITLDGKQLPIGKTFKVYFKTSVTDQ
ncbi:MAG: response regulator transcription factor [Cyclobacteriaceae bacterium]|nr:response regulator transcription factor [Cyclobacteriaceae bacterium]